MTLAPDTQKRFRTLGHALKPTVTVAGNGLSEGVCAELERALEDHELIKVKIAVADREERRELIAGLIAKTGAELVQSIGKMVLIFRAARKPKLNTSNIR